MNKQPNSYDQATANCQALQRALKEIGCETDWDVDEKHGFWICSCWPEDIDSPRHFNAAEKVLIEEFLKGQSKAAIWQTDGDTYVQFDGGELDEIAP